MFKRRAGCGKAACPVPRGTEEQLVYGGNIVAPSGNQMANRENKHSPIARESSVYSTTYKRKRIKGWWVGWYESGKRKAKGLPSKALAEHFRQIKYTQLNSDVFTGTITVDWQQMRDEYEHSKKVAGVTEDSLYEVALTLRNFE